MIFKNVIESKYDRQNWLLLLRDIFGNKAKFWNTPSDVPTNSPFARQALWLGTITLSDNQTISVYEVELSNSVDIERNRRGIRDMLLTQWRNNGNAGAFMLCYRKNESVLRFSYVSESWTFAEDGTYKKDSTDTKRFTYLLGEGHRSRTAIQQFEKLRDSALSLKDLTKAFSVDAVSDMFFDGYKKQYEDIIFHVTGKRMVKVANKWEERQEGKPNKFIMQQFAHFDNPEKAIRDYVKKLMGRLVFLQFLQKKGWLGVRTNAEWGTGDQEFIQNLFEQCKDKDHFVDGVLEVLFNDLNTERKNDNSQLSIFNYQLKVPYLNGGLFERDATDDTEFPLPAEYMKSLLDFFASYNFTIDENDPDDAEVGVDPEMLGRIFENLLEDNKDKGAFYTPKEIVTYMCRESLIAYLQTDIEDEATKEALRQFVTTHDVQKLGSNKKFRQQVDEALKIVKICDPAIGSGAFPMGLLKELFLCHTALEGIEQSKAAEIKKHIIQQNIYGVDIEKGAVDIARLRFWLSLIVDEETPQALPNLDFKIMQGNSLLEQYKGVDLSNITELQQDKVGNYQTTMFDDMLDVLRLDLRKKLDEYYSCPDHKKKAILKKDIINNVKQQLKEQSINIDFGDLDLAGNDQFMLWHTWFYDVFSRGGFDIVIGNPPYVVMDKSNPYKYFVTYKCYELYAYFYEQSLATLKERGVLSFITASLYVKGLKFESLRKLLNTKTQLLTYKVEGDKVFENVQMPTSTILLRLEAQPWTFEDLSDSGMITKKISRNSILLKDVSLIQRGFEIGRKLVKNSGEIPFITGSNICKYTYYSQSYIPFKVLKEYAKDDYYYNGERILIRETGSKLMAIYLDERLYCNRSLYSIKLTDTRIKPKYLVACLNSKVLQFYYQTKYKSETDLFPKIRIKQAKLLPIYIAEESEQTEIIGLVDKILLTKRADSSADTSAFESEIDKLVYQLYGLTEEEITIIENNSK